MDLKELLGEDLAKQVEEKLGDKKLIVNDGTYIPKSKFDDLNNDKKEIKKQLEEANTKIQELSGTNTEDLEKQIKEWKEKYENDTKSLNDKITKREKEYIIKDLTRDIKFSSKGAEKSFLEDLNKAELQIKDNKMLGFEDYLNSYKENDPNAFVQEKAGTEKEVDLGDTHIKKPEEDDSFARKVMGLA